MESIFAKLPNDIIIKILHENKINKQIEYNKHLFSDVLCEMTGKAGYIDYDEDSHEPIDFINVYDDPFRLLSILRNEKNPEHYAFMSDSSDDE